MYEDNKVIIRDDGASGQPGADLDTENWTIVGQKKKPEVVVPVIPEKPKDTLPVKIKSSI